MTVTLDEAGYLLRRFHDAGFFAVMSKIGQKVRPYAFWPAYEVARRRACSGAHRRADQQMLADFGQLLAGCVAERATADRDYRGRIAARAAEALGPSITVLGFGRTEKPRAGGWRRDPFHGHDWPLRYFPLCDFVATGIRCDVKIPWEMSRLQHLVWLAEGYLSLDDEARLACRRAFVDTLNDWVTANPVGYGVNWTCGMEVAIRATNICVAAGIFVPDLDPLTVVRICALLRAHLTFLYRFPEVSDVPGNHYLADLMGAVVLHAALDGLWAVETGRALDKFAAEADAQFEPDGCHLERATVYHRLALDMTAIPMAIALRSDHPSKETLSAIMTRASAFAAQLASAHGRLPVFGDQDSGFVLWFGEAAQQMDRYLINEPAAPETDQYALLAAVSGKPQRFFPQVVRGGGVRSGFATLVCGATRVTLKTGERGLMGRAPHDHDDPLSLWVSHSGRDVLIDAGCHSYTLTPQHRLDAILSTSHNSPTPARRERFTPVRGSIFATVRGGATAKLLTIDKTRMEGELHATPESRMALRRRVTLERTSCSTQLMIVDQWIFETPEAARILWRFDHAWHLMISEAGKVAGDAPVNLELEAEGGSIIRLMLSMQPPGAYRCVSATCSPTYGALLSCDAIEIVSGVHRSGTALLVLDFGDYTT